MTQTINSKSNIDKFQSYTHHNHEQFLNRNKLSSAISTVKPINARVSQEAVVFPIHTSDIPNHFYNIHILTFADETAIIFSPKNLLNSTQYLQNEFNNITSWVKNSKLQINPEKPHLTHF